MTYAPKHYVLDAEHKAVEVSLDDWARWLDDDAKRRVAKTDVNEHVEVSTVFLGLNHNFGEGPPLLFETMVFFDADDVYCRRYATWDEAVAGHDRAVRLCVDTLSRARRYGKRGWRLTLERMS